MYNCKYFVVFRGDDTDFAGNQRFIVKLQTELDLTGMTAHFRLLGFQQDFDEIPNDKKLEIVIPASSTSKFPLGSADAEVWLIDSEDRRRTVTNRIHFVITNSVREAYDNDDPQAITVVITGGGGGGSFNPKSIMRGEEIETKTIEKMRDSLRKIGVALGATVSCAAFIAISVFGASVDFAKLNSLDLDTDPNVVTNVTFDGLATTNQIDFSQANTQLVDTITAVAPSPGNYAAVSNAAMSAAQPTGITMRVGASIYLPMDEDYEGTGLQYGMTISADRITMANTSLSFYSDYNSIDIHNTDVAVDDWSNIYSRYDSKTLSDALSELPSQSDISDAVIELERKLVEGETVVAAAEEADYLVLNGIRLNTGEIADLIGTQTTFSNTLYAAVTTNAQQSAAIAANATAATNYTDIAIANADTSYRSVIGITNLNQSVQYVSLSQNQNTLAIEIPANGSTKDWIVYVLAATKTTLILPPATWYMTDTANTNDIPAGMTAFYFTQMTDGVYMLGRQELEPVTIQAGE